MEETGRLYWQSVQEEWEMRRSILVLILIVASHAGADLSFDSFESDLYSDYPELQPSVWEGLWSFSEGAILCIFYVLFVLFVYALITGQGKKSTEKKAAKKDGYMIPQEVEEWDREHKRKIEARKRKTKAQKKVEAKRRASRRDEGLSYSMQYAERTYKCHHTGRTIHIGDYHFANQRGIRLCKDALAELYPERAIDFGCKPVQTRAKPGVKVEAQRRQAEKVKDAPYIGSRAGHTFHRPGRPCTQNLQAGNFVGFSSRKNAVKEGYKPCRRCKPGQTETKHEREAKEPPAYFGSTTGHAFHREECPSVKRTKKEDLMFFHSIKEAMNFGYKKCGHCKP